MLSEGVYKLIETVVHEKFHGPQEMLSRKCERYMLYLKDLLKALDKVDSSYYVINYMEDYDHETIEKIYERMFAYELYHQLRLIIGEREDVLKRYLDVTLNGEMPKSCAHYKRLLYGQNQPSGNKRLDKLIKKCFGQKDRLTPDLILHEAGNLDQQVYLVEIKMANNDCYYKDFEKLTNLKKCLEELGKIERCDKTPDFNFYIFVYEGDLEFKLSYSKEAYSIVCDESKVNRNIVCYYRIGNEFQCCTLAEVIKNVEDEKVRRYLP